MSWRLSLVMMETAALREALALLHLEQVASLGHRAAAGRELVVLEEERCRRQHRGEGGNEHHQHDDGRKIEAEGEIGEHGGSARALTCRS
jgi:hypothetical protein